MATARTLFQKIWDAHVVAPLGGDNVLLYIDRHLVNEVTSPQAFEGLRQAGRTIPRPAGTIAVADHNVPTENSHLPIADEESRHPRAHLESNAAACDMTHVAFHGTRQTSEQSRIG